MELVYVLGGVLLLFLGADSALKGLSGLKQTAGMSASMAGLFLVALATSVPEIFISVEALRLGATDLAMGNAMGSNLVNVGLTLGVALLVGTIVITMRLLSQLILLLMVALGMLLWLGFDGQLSRWEGLGLISMWLGIIALWVFYGKRESAPVLRELAEFAESKLGAKRNLMRLVLGSALLYAGAWLLVSAAVSVGPSLGLSGLLTGMTLLALFSAIPEMIVAYMGIKNGQGNMVLGVVLSACLFNVLVIMGGMALLQEISVPAALLSFEIPATMALVFVLYPMIGSDDKLQPSEGRILIALYVAWLIYELAMAWN